MAHGAAQYSLLEEHRCLRGPAGPYSQIQRRASRDRVRSGMREFESSHSSQPVRRPETLPSTMPQRPANGGLLRIGYRSPGSGIGVSGSEIADSLRRIFEIFPFSGDWGRRPGSICTAWPGLECKLANSPGLPPVYLEPLSLGLPNQGLGATITPGVRSKNRCLAEAASELPVRLQCRRA
jgi:hypothetical protein